jgi:hypothetical protein
MKGGGKEGARRLAPKASPYSRLADDRIREVCERKEREAKRSPSKRRGRIEARPKISANVKPILAIFYAITHNYCLLVISLHAPILMLARSKSTRSLSYLFIIIIRS